MKKARIDFFGEIVLVIVLIALLVYAFYSNSGVFLSDQSIDELIFTRCLFIICCCGALLVLGTVLMIIKDGIKKFCEYIKGRRAKGETA